ncbi:TetR/AcrR family transcriptional regulator [Paenibacillus typhae]|uniref:Transcriptional regulator, TetR family n=1 Tax=Paenibacillus typhae TaxID=1174501 RepID=A0A1G9EGT8_9BACL|nr:TetR/AcrR family transcriptional regulator [Paenibacillus typhae]SDK75336.1 transcriptional regulator, TetR family [Paenibacillus typhae]
MARNKEFDEQAVLDKAMELFWLQGYEKTSISELVEHMGIHRKSLYDTFTDKHSLFLRSIDRFGERVNRSLAAGVQQAGTAAEALAFVLGYMICGEQDMPPGCMLVNAATELAVRDAEADDKSRAGFLRTEQLLREIVERGQLEGEFTTRFSVEELARYLHNGLVGLRVLARTSVPKEQLQEIARLSVELLKLEEE